MLDDDLRARLCRARDLLREIGGPDRSVGDVAREVAMSPYHFSRRFKAVFGESPHQTRIEARLERARHLLVLTDRPVTDICLEVGFTSVGSFSHLFRRRVRITPTAYRTRHQVAGRSGALPESVAPGCLSLMMAAYAARPPEDPHDPRSTVGPGR